MCQDGQFVKGAKIRDEANLGWKRDDTAANGLKFECTDGQILSPGNGFWGSWSAMKTCPEGEVVYGMKTSVEGKQGQGDDTALNRVKFLCRRRGKGPCRIKAPLVCTCLQTWNKRIQAWNKMFVINWFVHHCYLPVRTNAGGTG